MYTCMCGCFYLLPKRTSAKSAVFTTVYGGPRDVVTDTDVVVAIRVTVTVQVLTRLRGDRC